VPNVEGLLRSLREANAAVANETTPTAPTGNTPATPAVTERDILNDLSPEALQQLEGLPANVKGKIMNAGMQAAANVPEGVPTGQML
jgi:hypothetical protein